MVLVPITVDWLCCCQAGRIHAAPWLDAHYARERGRKTVDTVCGLKRAHPYAATATFHGSDETDFMVLPWPPPVRGDEGERCRDCWEATGRKRPDPVFKRLRGVSSDG